MNGGINPGNTRKARSLGNDRPGDGFLFRGNGLLQTTGGKAHKEAGDQVRVDFFNHPELVTSAEHALKPVLFEWTGSRCNTFADDDNLLKISRAINLGNPIQEHAERHGQSQALPQKGKEGARHLRRRRAGGRGRFLRCFERAARCRD